MEFVSNVNAAKLFKEIPMETALYSSYLPSTALEDVLRELARNGRIRYEWHYIKALFRFKIYALLERYFKKCGFIGPITEVFDERRDLVLNLLDQYDEPPFTVQRIAELLTMEPYTQYHSTHKLINAFEKLLSVAGSSSPNS